MAWVLTTAEPCFFEDGVQGPQPSRDDQASDTLETFTTLLAELKQRQVGHLLPVTGVDHMPGAPLAGHIVAGSRGIQVMPAPVDGADACIRESPPRWRPMPCANRSSGW